MFSLVSESELPHKIVNLLFTITNDFLKRMNEYIMPDKGGPDGVAGGGAEASRSSHARHWSPEACTLDPGLPNPAPCTPEACILHP